MKQAKKLLALLLVAVLVISLGSLTAFAEGEDDQASTGYSITVDVNFEGQQYTLYKIFNATTNADRQGASDTSSDTSVTTDGIAYTLIDETGHSLGKEFTVTKADGTTATVKGSDWFKFVNESSKNITTVENADITTEEFRLWAQAYGQQIGEVLTADEDNDTKIAWTNLPDGYYFISTTTGSLVTVDSIAPNAIVKDKNTKPTVDKTVEEDSNGNYQKQNDAEIGQTVNFKSVIAAKKGGKGYKLIDKMSTGLAFDGVNSIKVYKGSVADGNLVAAANYTATAGGTYKPTSDSEEETADFTVEFKQSFLDTITGDTDLIVTYTATVTAAAEKGTGIVNKTYLEYGNNSHTEESTTKTYVWGVDILKHDKDDTTKTLEGAEFVIYKTGKVGEGDAAKDAVFYAKFDDNKKFAGWTEADEETVANLVKKDKDYFTNKQASVLATGEDGKIEVSGLDEGDYFLLEVAAPAGYNKLAEAKAFTIESDVQSTGTSLEKDLTSGTNGSTHIEVPNGKGTELPSTGGIGTTIFYVVGGLLLVGAGILLVTKKRVGNDV